MRPEARAVIFDLDDTLYPQRRFVLSGFSAVARHLAAQYGVSSAEAFTILCRVFRSPDRGREIQMCLQRLDLPTSITAELVERVRAHRPSLRLPSGTREVLGALRPDWRIGIVTNGRPPIQAAKIDALGLGALTDVLVYAAEHGTGRGKPDAEPFEAALTRLGVEPRRAVFVGDSEECDVRGAAAVGLHTVRVSRTPLPDEARTAADAIVASLRDVPAVVARLVGSTWSRDVA